MNFQIRNNGGRRSSIERRQIEYYAHIPEFRSGKDRRCGTDRRRLKNVPVPFERRKSFKE